MAWTCPTCAQGVDTEYCPRCGERRILPRELTLRGLGRQFLKSTSSIDGRLFRTLRALLARPGALTVAWVDGPRKPYVGPIQLFLLANVAFVAAQSLTGSNVFSSTLSSHLHQQDWSGLAQRLLAGRLARGPLPLAAYEIEFNRAVAFYAKSLVIVMTIPFAAILQALFMKRRRPFVLQMVFSLHFYSFLLLLYCIAIALSAIDLVRGGAGLESPRLDTLLTLFNLLATTAYLYFAVSRVYGARGIARLAASLALAIAVLAIALAYRFGLLLLTLRLV